MSFVTQVDSLTWPGTVPLGWSVDGICPWPAMTLRSNAMLWAEYGAYLCVICSRVVVFVANSEYYLVNLKFRIMLV
jgi:hypothetical protein